MVNLAKDEDFCPGTMHDYANVETEEVNLFDASHLEDRIASRVSAFNVNLNTDQAHSMLKEQMTSCNRMMVENENKIHDMEARCKQIN